MITNALSLNLVSDSKSARVDLTGGGLDEVLELTVSESDMMKDF
jgi:hypothetical protein